MTNPVGKKTEILGIKMTESTKKILSEILAVVVGLIVAFITPPQGLEPQAMWAIGLLIWAIINWVLKPIEHFAVVLIMCAAWVYLKILPFKEAFAAFSGTTIWLLICVLGIGTAVTNSGLLKRMTLLSMKLFPPTFKGQVMALIGTGTIISPFIPSTSAKMAVAGGIPTGIGEALGFKPRSMGMAGLFNAMQTGFCLGAPIFLSASIFSYALHGMLPQDVQAQFTWFYWFLGMIPWGIVFLVCSYFGITWMYKQDASISVPSGMIKKQIEELGPMKREEKLTLTVLLICIVLWIFEKQTGIASIIPAMVGCSVLAGLDIIKPRDINTKLPWTLIIFMGGLMTLGDALRAVGIVDWIATTYGSSIGYITSNIYLLIIVIVLLVVIAKIVIVEVIAILFLLLVIFTPFCTPAGINPWVVAMIAYTPIMQFQLVYQNLNLLTAYAAGGGEEKYDLKLVFKYNVLYTLFALAGLLVSVPYWQFLGLIK